MARFLGRVTAAAVLAAGLLSVPLAVNAAETYTMKTHYVDESVGWVEFTQDAKRVAFFLTDGPIRFRDIASDTVLATIDVKARDLISVGLSPDGGRVVTGTNDAVRIHDVATGREIAVMRPGGPVYAVAFSPDGKRLVTANADHTVRLWDAETGKELLVLAGHTEPVMEAVFSPDGTRIATASRDRTARIWDAAGGGTIVLLPHAESVNSVAFSPDGKRLVTGANDGIARVFDISDGTEILSLSGHTDDVLDATFSPDGQRIVTASYDNGARRC